MKMMWILFAAVQIAGVLLASFSNVHTAGFSFLAGFLLLAPGILISSKIGVEGATSAFIAILINAFVWHVVFTLFKSGSSSMTQ
jgi:hypothetical protein